MANARPWFAALLMVAISTPAAAGGDGQHLETVVATLDAKLFQAGFNECDIAAMSEVVARDLEFYHDQSGAMMGKEAFVASIRDGICKLDYKARRELVEDSMSVHPLHRSGELYGMLQQGEHRFYAKYEGAPEKLTSTARFAILWLLEDGEWRMSRVYSYDHAAP